MHVDCNDDTPMHTQKEADIRLTIALAGVGVLILMVIRPINPMMITNMSQNMMSLPYKRPCVSDNMFTIAIQINAIADGISALLVSFGSKLVKKWFICVTDELSMPHHSV